MHKERGVYLKDALEHNTSLLKTTLVEQQQYKATQDMLVANQRAVIAKMQETSDRSVDQHAIPAASQQHPSSMLTASQQHPNCIPTVPWRARTKMTLLGCSTSTSTSTSTFPGEGGDHTRTCPCLLETTLCWTPFVCNAMLTWLRAQR